MEIIDNYNKGDNHSKKYARNKLKLSRFILGDKTFFYLLEKMGGKLSAHQQEIIKGEKVLRLAKKYLGGKIVD